MKKLPEDIEKKIDEMRYSQAIKLYDYIKNGSLTDPISVMIASVGCGGGMDRGIFATWTLERKKELLDSLISDFKEMGHDDKVKYLERELILLTEGGGEFDSGGSGKCVIRLVSIETVGDVESWGHDGHYYHDIVVAIPDKIFDEDEKFVLEKIAKGEFVLEGKIWCSELEDPLSKANIMKVASSSISLREFSKDVMEDMYTALVGWCRSKWPGLKEREIYEIARAISEPMFGGEDMDSEASIDFIECDYEEPEKFEAPKEPHWHTYDKIREFKKFLAEEIIKVMDESKLSNDIVESLRNNPTVIVMSKYEEICGLFGINFSDLEHQFKMGDTIKKEDKKESKGDVINELFRRAFAASTPKGDWDEMLDKAELDEKGKKIIHFENYKCPKEIMNKIFDDVMEEFNVSEEGRKVCGLIFWMGPSPRN